MINPRIITLLHRGLPFLLGLIWLIFGFGCYLAENHIVGFHLAFWALFFALQVSTGALVGVLLQRLYLAANTDGLTQLWNRKYFYREATRTADTAIGKPASLILLDLDYFKQVNDSRGHQTGDEVLKIVADVLRQNTRPTDTVARLGGDEFAILLEDSGSEITMDVAERIRKAAQERLAEFKVTMSVGVTPLERNLGIDRAVATADKALYQAKEKKNSVVSSIAHPLSV